MLLSNVHNRGAMEMKFLRIAGFAVAVALASSPAGAFQEQQVGGGAVQAGPAPGIVIDNSKAPSEGTLGGELEFSTPVQPAESGAKVFLPGLGTLGVLPKLDFGLELLYGASETPDTEPGTKDLLPGDEDLMIRGRVKHRF
jgi:hypothetical protein